MATRGGAVNATSDGEPPLRATPFKFKGSEGEAGHDGHARKRRRVSPSHATSDNGHTREKTQHRRHRHRHRHHHHHGTERASHGSREQNAYKDSEAAFRESLFDAMADDEGADYWQEVYGQPIHIYADTRPGQDGELERMTDDEYVEHVRARMWEKTHQHIIEERKRREEAARRQHEQQAKAKADADIFQKQMQESLERGSRRRQQKAWQDAHDTYVKRWEQLHTAAHAGRASDGQNIVIPWPVRSGERKDVDAKSVEAFLSNTAGYTGDRTTGRLKAERVRWHPDKMQQRVGQGKLDEATMKTVTAVFQIIDDLWAQTKR